MRTDRFDESYLRRVDLLIAAMSVAFVVACAVGALQ